MNCGGQKKVVVEEIESWDIDDGRASATICLEIVCDIIDLTIECAEDEDARMELEHRLALFDDMTKAECLGLPLSFGSKKKQRRQSKKGNYYKRTKRVKPKSEDLPEEKANVYWAQRHLYFGRFDLGISLDKESWYSVTPEKIAKRIATRVQRRLVFDGFCGVGGNAIQFALNRNIVVAIDCDFQKLKMAQHNAQIYGVTLDLVLADATTFMQNKLPASNNLFFDLVFLSPPWGGPSYLDLGDYDPKNHIHLSSQTTSGPLLQKDHHLINGHQLAQFAAHLAPNLAYFLPKTTPLHAARDLTHAYLNIDLPTDRKCPCFPFYTPLTAALNRKNSIQAQFESHHLNGKLKGKTLYIVRRPDLMISFSSCCATVLDSSMLNKTSNFAHCSLCRDCSKLLSSLTTRNNDLGRWCC
mmetsp:Transcript_7399/g.11024  ORF Transcript_7399/g.11024 Transcript_7399/m.11024 type:complete len:412 (-) Transcript_7399:186-1421(-)